MGKQILISNFEIVKKIMATHAPNQFSQPKWVRTGKAKITGGQCRYSIIVPPNKEFYLMASGHGRGFACTSIDVLLRLDQGLGPHDVPLGGKKTVNLFVTNVKCNMLA
jgi:hypothetical protein